MWKRLLAWLAFVGLTQILLFSLYLVGGSFSYMGGRDTESMRTALSLYGPEIQPFLVRLWSWDCLVLAVWTLPVGVAFARRQELGGRVRPGLLVAAFFLAYGLWLALCALRVPTLLSANFYGDGQGFTAALMRAVCSKAGPVWLTVGFLLVAGAIARAASWRHAAFALGFYGVAILGLTVAERYRPRLTLKPGSVIVLMADSLRADRVNATDLPKLFPLIESANAVTVPAVVPPLARTTPAIVSLLTGRFPVETGVTTMFSNKETFKQVPSVVTAYRDAGYCTLAVGEYPAEMLSKYTFGFEFVEVPQTRFKEISLQAVMMNDPFFLASQSWGLLRSRMDPQMQRLFEGLPTFAAPKRMLSNFEAYASRCGDRPLFALVFADQPHFPYVQTWPYYLQKGGDYTGPFKFGKDDATRGSSSPEDKARVRELYSTSLLSTDDAFSRLVAHLLHSGQLETSTVILTGDHGESLYDHLDIVGHGDQIGEMEGISVPWVVLGARKETFATALPLMQSTRLASKLAQLNGLSYASSQALPENVIYVETDLWMAHTPNVPKNRVRYPELSGLLTLEDKEAHIEVDRSFLPTVEFAKHRLWVVDGKRYAIEPGDREIRVTVDGQPADPRQFPEVIRAFMHRYYPDVAPALVP